MWLYLFYAIEYCVASVPGVLDFLVTFLRFNVQFTVYPPPPQKGVEFFAPLRSAQSRGPPDLVRPCPKTWLRHVLSINKTSLWSIGKRERRSSRFLTPFFLWTRGESNLSSNSCIPWFYWLPNVLFCFDDTLTTLLANFYHIHCHCFLLFNYMNILIICDGYVSMS